MNSRRISFQTHCDSKKARDSASKRLKLSLQQGKDVEQLHRLYIRLPDEHEHNHTLSPVRF